MDEVANLVDIDLSEFAETEKVDTETCHQSQEVVGSDNNEALDNQEFQLNVEVEAKEPVSEEADSMLKKSNILLSRDFWRGGRVVEGARLKACLR